MAGRVRSASWRAGVLALAASGVVVLGGNALAGHIESGVKSYTGCLVPKDGVIIKVKEGNSPASPCTGGQTLTHLSGGDITRISGGTGVTVSPASSETQSGHVTINLDAKYSLPQNCDPDDVARWGSDDEWICGSFRAGTGLELNSAGDTFSIDRDYRVKNTPDCTSGKFAYGFDSNGTIQCATPAPAAQSLSADQKNFASGDGVPDDGDRHKYVTLALKAGSYVIMGKGVLLRGDDDIGFQMSEGAFGCGLSFGTQTLDQTRFAARDNEEDESYGFSLLGLVTTQTGDDLILWCDAEADADKVSVRNARVVAIKVG